MSRILSLIILAFTMVTLASSPSFASMFVQKPEAPQPTKETSPEIESKEELYAMPHRLVIKHCMALAQSITNPFAMVDAYNNQPDLSNLPDDADYALKQKAVLYMMGRPDIPDFGFLIPEIWRVTSRDQRQKFNAISTLKLSESLAFRYGGYPFQGNCRATVEGEITTDSKGFERARISVPLAFDNKEAKLVYILSRQPNYNWQIDDLLVNNAGAAYYIRKNLANDIKLKGIEDVLKDICQSSSIGTLNCKKNK